MLRTIVFLSLAVLAGCAQSPPPVVAAPAPAPAETATFAMTIADEEHDDRDFVKAATLANLAEIRLSKLAQEKSKHPRVRTLAVMSVEDHTKANARLTTLAREHGMALPLPNGRDPELDRLQGRKFEVAYVKRLVKGHQQAVRLFETEAREGQNEDLRAFAVETLPKLRRHLQLAQQALPNG